MEQRRQRIVDLRQEANRLLEIEDHPPIQTLVRYALQALDEADRRLAKPSTGQRQPLLALVDVEIAAAEGRLKVVMDLLEQYGTDMGWDDD